MTFRLHATLPFLFVFYSFFIQSIVCGQLSDHPPGYYCYTDGHLHTADPCRFFAAVIDAGSTGTRLHLYRFVHNTFPHTIPFSTEDETFKEVKPGLSAFNENPAGAALSVRELLQKAHETIPPELWEKTPIALKATAGLRLLPKEQADAIMQHVSSEVESSGFFVTDHTVEILDGQDEGVYSWFTLNLLLNTLYQDASGKPAEPAPERSVAAFDLGGGSTQVTFWPADQSIFVNSPIYQRNVDFFDTHMHLFSHSFLGNGLISARLGVLQLETHDQIEVKGQLHTACMPRDFEIPSWDYALKSWRVRGSEHYSYNACEDAVTKFVKSSDIVQLDHLEELNKTTLFKSIGGHVIYMFSYFFDRGLNAGLVKDNNGGRTTLEKFGDAAQKACQYEKNELSNGKHWMPWQCLDLTYIYVLLKEGYGFRDEQPLFLAKKLRGMEVSWGQGLAHALVNDFHETALPDIGGRSSNITGSFIVDKVIDIVMQRTNDILQYFNIIS